MLGGGLINRTRGAAFDECIQNVFHAYRSSCENRRNEPKELVTCTIQGRSVSKYDPPLPSIMYSLMLLANVRRGCEHDWRNCVAWFILTCSGNSSSTRFMSKVSPPHFSVENRLCALALFFLHLSLARFLFSRQRLVYDDGSKPTTKHTYQLCGRPWFVFALP